MKLVSHRGFWDTKAEQNTITSFQKAINHKFGIETDIRDDRKSLIVSHDPGDENSVLADHFFQLVSGSNVPIALNIKSDGLAKEIEKALEKYELIDTAFAFDMSVPDMRSYFPTNIRVFGRISDIESEIPWQSQCEGVWVDAFEQDWLSNSIIDQLLSTYKNVCVVSPELHQRGHERIWEMLVPFSIEAGLMLCTDFPVEAEAYFND